MKKIFHQLTRKKDRVYILPTKMGGYMNGLIFLMFLLSVGYSNNLMLIFTLLLFGLNLAWAIQTHFYLDDTKLLSLHIPHSHAKNTIICHYSWESPNIGRLPERRVCLIGKDYELDVHSIANELKMSRGSLTFPKRGIYQWKYLRLESEGPLGFYRAWKYIEINHQSVVYPELLNSVTPPLFVPIPKESDKTNGKIGNEDFVSLGPYKGEEARMISWKHYARLNEVFIKEGEDSVSSQAIFSLSSTDEVSEETLSILASQMTQCHHENIPFIFDYYSLKLGPANDSHHLSTCLRKLAEC